MYVDRSSCLEHMTDIDDTLPSKEVWLFLDPEKMSNQLLVGRGGQGGIQGGALGNGYRRGELIGRAPIKHYTFVFTVQLNATWKYLA